MSQSLSDDAEAGVSRRVFRPLLDCPKPLFGKSAVDSASGSCCGAVAINRTRVRKVRISGSCDYSQVKLHRLVSEAKNSLGRTQ